MLQLQEQYITNAQGDRIAVILDIIAYQKLLDEMDEFLCWKGYQQALEETDLEIANGDSYALVFSNTKLLSDRLTDSIGICAIASVAKA